MNIITDLHIHTYVRICTHQNARSKSDMYTLGHAFKMISASMGLAHSDLAVPCIDEMTSGGTSDDEKTLDSFSTASAAFAAVAVSGDDLASLDDSMGHGRLQRHAIFEKNNAVKKFMPVPRIKNSGVGVSAWKEEPR